MSRDDVSACPYCRSTDTHFLPGVSGSAIVNYYRCGCCAHIWTAEKDDRAARLVALKPDRRRLAKADGTSSSFRRRKTDRV